MSAAVDRVLDRLEHVRPAGRDRWRARCPAHEDREPSLSVRVGSDGRMLVHCFSGCQTEAVLTAVGLRFSDLFPERPAPGYVETPEARLRRHVRALERVRDRQTAVLALALRVAVRDLDCDEEQLLRVIEQLVEKAAA